MNRTFGTLSLALALLLAAPPSLAAPSPAAPPPSPVLPRTDAAEMRARVEELKKRPAAEEPAVAEAVAEYEKALEFLRKAEEWARQTAAQETYRKEAPARVEALRKEAERPWSPVVPSFAKRTDAELDRMLEESDAELSASRKELSELEGEWNRLAQRRIELPKALVALRGKADPETATNVPAAEGEVARARAARHAAERVATAAELTAGEKEALTLDLRADELKLRREAATRRTGHLERVRKAAEAEAGARRKSAAEQAAERARSDAKRIDAKTPELAALARRNAELAEWRTGTGDLVSEQERIAQDLAERQRLLARVREDHRALRERVRISGRSQAIGVYLRVKREELPDVRRYRRSISARADRITLAQLQIRELDEETLTLVDLDEAVRLALDASGAGPERRAALEPPARELLRARRTLLDALLRDLNAWFVKLVDLEGVERQLIEETAAFGAFLDEHILWIRSSPVVSFETFRQAGRALGRLLAPRNGTDLAAAFARSSAENPAAHLFALLALLLGFRLLRPGRARLAFLGEQVARHETDSLRHTAEASLLTLALALPLPLVLAWLAALCAAGEPSSLFVRSFADALRETSVLLFALLSIRCAFSAGGLAEAHFRLRPEDVSRRVLDRAQKIAVRYGVPAHFLIVLLLRFRHEASIDSLGRLLFLAGTSLVAWLAYTLDRSSAGLAYGEFGVDSPETLGRLRLVHRALFVALPASFALLAAAGWFYSARYLFSCWAYTLLTLALALFANAAVSRLLAFLRRSLAVKAALARLSGAEEEPPASTGEPSPSIHVLGNQARTLASVLLVAVLLFAQFAIWHDVIPAFRTLDRVTLWKTTVSSGAAAVSAGEGEAATRLAQTLVPVTLLDALGALFAFALTAFLARNLPPFLEFALLRRTALDHGERFALRTLIGYGITILGTLVSFQMIYVGWDKVQWLAAAVSVGLGFGLQEIFANFVSGLILLFERPIRVGDVVTMGADTGEVTRIQIRATTIVNWDRREIVIPNKELITGRLVNWTLSDSIQRVVFKVGVDYGADADRVRDLLLAVAAAHPDVLGEPPPRALFTGFADSSLSFELRTFIPNLERYSDFVHEMNRAIHRALNEAGVPIPYPIRDVRIRKDGGEAQG